MYLFGTLDPHPPTATSILEQGPEKSGFLQNGYFHKKVLDFGPQPTHSLGQSPKKNVFFYTFPYQQSIFWYLE